MRNTEYKGHTREAMTRDISGHTVTTQTERGTNMIEVTLYLLIVANILAVICGCIEKVLDKQCKKKVKAVNPNYKRKVG